MSERAAASGAAASHVSERRQRAIEFMDAFAARTGLGSDRPEKRYLWTDAFAVRNFLGLARSTGDPRYEALALRLVDRVHHTLGRHRSDDGRTGWLSGLAGEEAERHPTLGGLRIGKELPERRPGEPYDPALEWDRDGQYFHYLVQWMLALDLVARTTGQAEYSRFAVELAEAAHRAFAVGPPGARRMVWKMSIDLSRPLVPSMGHHDPLDGYVTYSQLAATAGELGDTDSSLKSAIADFASMMGGRDLATDDPLGIGGLLSDAYRAAVLVQRGAAIDERLVEALFADALAGLRGYARQRELEEPAARRLAFRELGLAIGLSAVVALRQAGTVPAGSALERTLQRLSEHESLGETIVSFWLDPMHQRAPSWTDHRDINEVMLATSLAPEGFLELPRVEEARAE